MSFAGTRGKRGVKEELIDNLLIDSQRLTVEKVNEKTLIFLLRQRCHTLVQFLFIVCVGNY